jgi:hypothetical protein
MPRHPARKRTDVPITFRHSRERKAMLQVIRERDDDPDLSTTIRRAVDEFLDRHLLRRKPLEPGEIVH